MKQQVRDAEIHRLKGLADQRIRAIRRMRKPISPTRQLQRFVDGVEYERLVRGEITPEQYQVYVDEMAEKLRRRVENV